MRKRVFPYLAGSRSASALAGAIGGRVLRREGSTFVPRFGDKIINWGASQCPLPVTLNQPEAVALAGNKRSAFERLHEAGLSIPRFSVDRNGIEWPGTTVVRHVLRGHSGEGLEIVEAGREPPPNAPLYVEYIPKQDEYRIHVVNGRVIAKQRKARDRSNDDPDWRVRNHQNGFIFVREGFDTPDQVVTLAVGAVAALGLDFGAADIIYNARRGAAYCLEVNTAPGLEGQTVTDYAEAFIRLF